MGTSVYSFSSLDWETFLQNEGQSPHILKVWLDGLYKNKNLWNRHIAPAFLTKLKTEFDFLLPKISQVLESDDGTIKFQMRFHDGMDVETVLIPFHKRFTICLSTQVGCGMNCSFCYTATQGLKRHLDSHEIVGQYLVAFDWLLEKNPKAIKPSLVFMGQGEPLHNLEALRQAVKIFNDPRLVDLGLRQMTLSTVGYLPGLKSLQDFPQINFALSLHSPFEDERTELIPINQCFTLSEVLKALDDLPLLPKQFITFEYLLIKDFNMSDRHVEELYQLLSHRKAIINLIPFNPFPGCKWQRPETSAINLFRQKLVAKKLRVMLRSTKGSDILAACGQLKINTLARNYVQS